jgi:hypothetical protein
MTNTKTREAVDKLRAALAEETENDAIAAEIFITAEETRISILHRSPEDLKRKGTRTRNLKGEWIK